MTISATSSAASTPSHISPQKTGAAAEQTEKSRSGSSSERNLSENTLEDKVTLSQAGKTSDSSEVIDGEAAEKLLSQAIEAILAESEAAVSAQANISPQAAQKFLAEN